MGHKFDITIDMKAIADVMANLNYQQYCNFKKPPNKRIDKSPLITLLYISLIISMSFKKLNDRSHTYFWTNIYDQLNLVPLLL